ncbi:MAG: ATP-binding protein [Acidimicrobiales bacterium]
MARLTVRARITALATLVVAVVLALAGLGLIVQQRRVLTEALDESLEQRAIEIAAQAEERPRVLTALGDDDAFAQIVRDAAESDEVLASSNNLSGDEPVVATSPPGISTVDDLPQTEDAFRVLVHQAVGFAVIVGSPTDDIEDSITTLQRSLVVGVPLVVAALALVLWWVVGRALRPVEAIRAEVAEIGARDLHRRVPVPASDDEVGRLARTMNDMLKRVDDAAQRQRRFVADASHELRSPLTRIRTELEVDLAHPDQADLLATHASVLDETVGIQRLADDLLLVARADEGNVMAERHQPVDVDDVVLRVARRLRADDRVQVDLSGVGAGRVVGDPDLLTRLIGNLADNAVRHATTTVTFTLAERDGRVVLTVEDDGRGVPEADRERIFERFARVDSARTGDRGGTGLGLAIARDIAESHRGTLVLDPATPGARFTLTLPTALS